MKSIARAVFISFGICFGFAFFLTCQAQTRREDCFSSLPTDENCDTRDGELHYYFNTERAQCELFKYQGVYDNCKTTANVFSTRVECETVCDFKNCFYPWDAGQCVDGDGAGQSTHWAFRSATSSCESFTYSGCGGNSNNFVSAEACSLACQPNCSASIHRGLSTCDEQALRWVFQPAEGSCQQFVWSGCGGNSNNFETERECMLKCGRVIPCELTVCETTCPWGYKRNHEGCAYCDCYDPCQGFTCPPDDEGQPQQAFQFIRSCDTFSCRRLDYSVCRCFKPCYGGAVFDTCTKAPRDCDATCEDRSRQCIPLGGCIPRCRCPQDKPLLHEGACVSSDQCPTVSGVGQLQDPTTFTCDFQTLCGMDQVTGDGGGWVRQQEANFLTLDLRRLVPNEMAEISTPTFADSRCLTFRFQMTGEGPAHLEVLRLTLNTREVIWNYTKNNDGLVGPDWQETALSLPTPTEQLMFRGSYPGISASQAEISVDDVTVVTYQCSQTFNARSAPLLRSGTVALRMIRFKYNLWKSPVLYYQVFAPAIVGLIFLPLIYRTDWTD